MFDTRPKKRRLFNRTIIARNQPRIKYRQIRSEMLAGTMMGGKSTGFFYSVAQSILLFFKPTSTKPQAEKLG